MAFFKFRWPGRGEQQQTEKSSKRPRAPQAESVEVMRRRARHRLIGAAVLVLVGVIGFPLLFDTQPRPVPVDIPIEIPDRNKVAPLVVPASVTQVPAAKPSAAAAPASPARATSPGNGVTEGEELVPATRPTAVKPAPSAPAKVEAKVEAKPEHKPEPKEAKEAKEAKVSTQPDHKPTPPSDDSARARALLEGRAPTPVAPAAAAPGNAEDNRFIVQVGAFADADKAREARIKLERAGMKTYMQVVDTKDGKRTRVRVGPFGSRADADKAAARIKGLDLPASVLTL